MHDFSIRESSRARNVRLKVTVDEGLVVVIPNGFDHSRIPSLLDSERDWIRRAQRWAEEQRLLVSPEPRNRLPRHIHLQAIDERWQVDYRATASSRVVARDHEWSRLRVSGDPDDIPGCLSALRRWTARRTHQQLVPWLRRLSAEQNLPFDKAVVRNQSSRWASCSPQRTISINQKMLFLPPHLVNYVFIHELCHLVHLNHSSRFWDLVSRKEPAYRRLDRELSTAWKSIPSWLDDQ
ncbi:MAG TPA: DUF45 domain-containing protein [Actinobacteria bacterium]|nr:DUF45 domain-containing protein [Actinomycetota bacterium]